MKKKISKIIGLLTATTAAICPIAGCGCSKNSPSEYHIMHISDIHGEIPGYGDDYFTVNPNYAGAIRTADAMQEIASRSKTSVILAGGDQNSSGTFSAPTKGKSMYPVLKEMKVDYSAVGNHAWDWGEAALQNQTYDMLGRTDSTDGNYFISANIINNPDYRGYQWHYDETKTEEFQNDFNQWNTARASWADPYKILDFNNHKICLIGLTTQDTLIDGNQQELKNYAFSDYIASIHYAKYLLKITQGEEIFNQIESFIVLAHCGATINDQKYIGGEVGSLAINLDTKVDAILAGHTHTPICGRIYNNKIDNPIWIVETSPNMQNFSDTELVFDDSKPVGQRLKSINVKLVTPNIDNSSQEAAHTQLQNIIDNPRNEVVQKTANQYFIQKEQVKSVLQSAIGKSTSGLSYIQKDYLFDYKYPSDIFPEAKKGVLVEQAGAFMAKAEIQAFNDSSSAQSNRKADICYIGNSSIHEQIEPGDVSLKELYGLYPYDNYTVTASLTYFQLQQIISYMLTGATLDTETRLHGRYCTDEYQYDSTSESFLIPQLRYPYGPNQFYGFSYCVELADSTDPQARKYAVSNDRELLVYDADDENCDFNDPSKWYGKSHWMNDDGTPKKYIRVVMSNFDFYQGNNQNMMIYLFAVANGLVEYQKQEEQIIEFSAMDPRDLTISYMKKLTAEGKTIDMSDDICKQLIVYKG